MLIEFSFDRMGSLYLRPVSKRWQRRIGRHLAEFSVAWDGDVLLQEGSPDIEPTLELLPSQKRQALEAGWGPVTSRVDPWIFLHHVGYDAHCL
ncbi:MAG: hypothetical protein ABIJ09_17540 [Pseudomonadota bacterium]